MEKYIHIIGNFIEKSQLCCPASDLHKGFELFFILLSINAVVLLIYCIISILDELGLFRILIHIVYVIFHVIFLFLIGSILTILLGGLGIIIFSIIWFVILMWSIGLVFDDDEPYILGFGRFANTICDRYYDKKEYYKNLKDDYKDFIRVNKDII